MTGKDVLKLLKKNGWAVARIKGSHHIMTHPNFTYPISVPVHSGEMPTGTMHRILKLANLR